VTHTLKDIGALVESVLARNRKAGKPATIVIKDDGGKIRIGEEVTTLICKRSIKYH